MVKMTPLELIQLLDNKSSTERKQIVWDLLQEYFSEKMPSYQIVYDSRDVNSVVNLIVNVISPSAKKCIGISCHYDVVENTGGANDNASAIAVLFEILKKVKELHDSGGDISLRLFFFDQEETGLGGSSAYVKDGRIDDMIGLINLEMVGRGDRFAIWPVSANTHGSVLEAFENECKSHNIESYRMTDIVTNTADHVPFQRAGLDSFSITRISEQDLNIAQQYYQRLYSLPEPSNQELFQILSNAPLFQHYHKPTDVVDIIDINSINETTNIVWQTVLNISNVI